jgi:DNA-binding transcriptional MerR regulator
MREPIDVKVKQMPRVGRADDGRMPFYSVTELGRDLGVTARSIRFYEDKGLIAPRRAGRNRIYSPRDRGRIILILRGKQLGLTLHEIKEYLDLYEIDNTHAKQLRVLVREVRSRILRLQKQRVALNQTLAELRKVESQAKAALARLAKAERRAA